MFPVEGQSMGLREPVERVRGEVQRQWGMKNWRSTLKDMSIYVERLVKLFELNFAYI